MNHEFTLHNWTNQAARSSGAPEVREAVMCQAASCNGPQISTPLLHEPGCVKLWGSGLLELRRIMQQVATNNESMMHNWTNQAAQAALS